MAIALFDPDRKCDAHVCVFGTLLVALLILPHSARSEDQCRRLCLDPPVDAIVLFDGQDTNGFVNTVGGPGDWPIIDHALVSTPNSRRSNNLVSALHFRDARIHVEFQLPHRGDGNSGIYLHGVYELQILGAPSVDVPSTRAMGAIYGLHKPLVDAARPPGVWQTFDVCYRAPRRNSSGQIVECGLITAWLNGRLIHNHAPVGNATSQYNPFRYDTTAYLAGIAQQLRSTMTGPLILQDHDSAVRFRNIWIRPLDEFCGLYDAQLQRMVPRAATKIR